MNSRKLKKLGFNRWVKISQIQKNKDIVPKKPATYVFRLNKTIPRLKGNSDILYIGSTGNLRERIYGNYVKGQGGPTTKRIRYMLFKKGYIDRVEISWKTLTTRNESKKLEKELLEKYEKGHHELPPWNRQG